jgi:hypothetical protein
MPRSWISLEACIELNTDSKRRSHANVSRRYLHAYRMTASEVLRHTMKNKEASVAGVKRQSRE